MPTEPEPTPSSSQEPPAAQQRLHVRSGDNSPVNISAPHAYAGQGGTANANVTTNQPAAASGDDYPKSFWRDPKIVGIGTVLIVLLTAALLYFTLYPKK
ncbi:hypothetical protein [Streptomyces sp. NPDC002573]|uniref:hypothetical protein n=1 Tax=Streptomyces sp. NPDC002573 TaxID=3364651 RepID=UPI003690B173